jgi:uncharacterized membrane protein YfbV (UPF0208 family)
MADWERYLRVVMPMLAIHDLTEQIAQAQYDLGQAVCTARAAGVSGTEIGKTARLSEQAARARWSGLPR